VRMRICLQNASLYKWDCYVLLYITENKFWEELIANFLFTTNSVCGIKMRDAAVLSLLSTPLRLPQVT
jgi:hypothetical protein